MNRNTQFEEWEARKLQDPGFRAAAEELEPAYQVARLRMERGWTQKELARHAGTKQSSIARLESGRTQPSLSFLRRVAEALGARVEIRIAPDEQVAWAARTAPAAHAVEAARDAAAERVSLPVRVLDWTADSEVICHHVVIATADSEAGARSQAVDHEAQAGILVSGWPTRQSIAWTDRSEADGRSARPRT